MFSVVIVVNSGLEPSATLVLRRVLFAIGKGVAASDYQCGLSDLLVLMASPVRQYNVEGRILFYEVENLDGFKAVEQIREEQQVDCKIHLLFVNQLGFDSRFTFAQDLDVLRTGGGKDRYGEISWVKEHLGVTPDQYPEGMRK